jgi:hypothetical protein
MSAKCKLCVYYLSYYNLPGIGSFKKEMVEAGEFESTTFQL